MIDLLNKFIGEEVRPDNVVPEPTFEPPRIEVVRGVRFKQFKYATKSSLPEGLVVHYTVSGNERKNAIGVVTYLAKQGLGCPVMDKDGVIYIPEGFDILRNAAYHAGKSAWQGRTSLSKYFIGMEICCWGRSSDASPPPRYSAYYGKPTGNIAPGYYQPFTGAQIDSLKNFIMWLSSVNPHFDLKNLVGHDEIAPGRKTDPGGSLGMTMSAFRQNMYEQINP